MLPRSFYYLELTVSQVGMKLILLEKFILSNRLLSLNCNMRVTVKTQRMSLKTQPKGFCITCLCTNLLPHFI